MTGARENHPVFIGMISSEQFNKRCYSTRTRWLIAIFGAAGVLICAFLLIAPENTKNLQKYPQFSPMIRLVEDEAIRRERDYEAFFLPTRYNFSLSVPLPNVSSKGGTKINKRKPVFSPLDRLRILRTFSERFAESGSKYWTVSNINMRPTDSLPDSNKHFVEQFDKQISGIKKVLENLYSPFTDFGPLDDVDNEYSR